MSRVVNDNLVLSIEESRNLLEALLMPREEVLARRNAFFESIDEMEIERNADGTVFIEIPDLKFDNLNYKVDLLDDMGKDNYWFSKEAFIEVNYGRKKVQIKIEHVQYSTKSADVDKYYDVKNVNVAEAA